MPATAGHEEEANMSKATESVCTSLRNAAYMMLDSGFTIEQVQAWIAQVDQPSAGYVRLSDIPNTGSI